MELLNFNLSNDYIGIVSKEGRYFDLHNNFDFDTFLYQFNKRHFQINWKRGDGDWVGENEPQNIQLSFTNVSILRMKELNQDPASLIEFKSDDHCLSMIGFTTKEEVDFVGCLENSGLNTENCPIIIHTENEQVFIIFSESVELHIHEQISESLFFQVYAI